MSSLAGSFLIAWAQDTSNDFTNTLLVIVTLHQPARLYCTTVRLIFLHPLYFSASLAPSCLGGRVTSDMGFKVIRAQAALCTRRGSFWGVLFGVGACLIAGEPDFKAWMLLGT